MATSSTTPQDRAAQVDRAIDVIRELTGRKDERDEEVIHLLADAGLLSSGTQEEEDGSLRSGPPAGGQGGVVEPVTAALRGYRIQLGPNALSLIKDGTWKSLPLSLGEMRDIAWILQDAGLLKGAQGEP